ncbi:hypothetical protein M2432_003172 [Mycobacterium sp. OTB74]|nr:hypothetical protein [Mycobacterium sp. OTB74]
MPGSFHPQTVLSPPPIATTTRLPFHPRLPPTDPHGVYGSRGAAATMSHSPRPRHKPPTNPNPELAAKHDWSNASLIARCIAACRHAGSATRIAGCSAPCIASCSPSHVSQKHLLRMRVADVYRAPGSAHFRAPLDGPLYRIHVTRLPAPNQHIRGKHQRLPADRCGDSAHTQCGLPSTFGVCDRPPKPTTGPAQFRGRLYFAIESGAGRERAVSVIYWRRFVGCLTTATDKCPTRYTWIPASPIRFPGKPTRLGFGVWVARGFTRATPPP